MEDLSKEIKLFKYLIVDKCMSEKDSNYKNYWQKKIPKGSNWYKNQTINKLGSETDSVIDEYKNVEIEYTFDENGYRLFKPESFENVKDEIFCFGCSFTFGFSLPEEHTWPYLLGKKLNVKPVNYGVGGVSTGFISRQIYQIFNSIPEEKYPKHVFILFPEIFRKEFFLNDDEKLHYHRFITGTHRGTSEKSKTKNALKGLKPEHIDSYFEGNGIVSLFFEFVKDFHFIDSILKIKNISWSWSSYSSFYGFPKQLVETYLKSNTCFSNCQNPYVKILSYSKYTPARDGSHRGKSYMEDIAKLFENAQASNLFCNKNITESSQKAEAEEEDFEKRLEKAIKLAEEQDFIYD